jgi:hypothetical protein
MTNPTPPVPVDPKSLEAYFTDVEYLRDYFQRIVAAHTGVIRRLTLTEFGLCKLRSSRSGVTPSGKRLAQFR